MEQIDKKAVYDALGITEEQLKNADDEQGILEILTGIDGDGDICFAYIAVKPSLYLEYQQKVSMQEEIDLDYYGNVLYSKKGQYPSAGDQAEIEAKFGVDHVYATKFNRDVERLNQQSEGI
ncbi:MAG: hypothetical protein CMH30_07030 [Micavibrio sp.]|nr:hypothetical protein [Micavibrio sp.]